MIRPTCDITFPFVLGSPYTEWTSSWSNSGWFFNKHDQSRRIWRNNHIWKRLRRLSGKEILSCPIPTPFHPVRKSGRASIGFQKNLRSPDPDGMQKRVSLPVLSRELCFSRMFIGPSKLLLKLLDAWKCYKIGAIDLTKQSCWTQEEKYWIHKVKHYQEDTCGWVMLMYCEFHLWRWLKILD